MIPAGTGPCASRLAIPRALGHFAPARLILGVAIGVLLLACGPGGPVVTPPISPGSAARPREVNIIAKDYSYLPSVVDLVPGETVLLHLVNGGLDAHEVVVGDAAVQAAWESAELAAAAVGGPPGATPAISLPPGLQGLRDPVGRAGRPDLDGPEPAGRGRLVDAAHRGLPHPGPLGEGDAGPGPLREPRRPRDPGRRLSGTSIVGCPTRRRGR